MDIFPTHECFDDAVSNLIFFMQRDGRGPVMRGEIVVVHAIIHPSDEPGPLAHAWIESETCVYFSGLIKGERVMVEADREEYYANANVKKAVKYTLFEAYAEERRRGHFGPWDAEIMLLCGRAATSKLVFRPREEQYQDN